MIVTTAQYEQLIEEMEEGYLELNVPFKHDLRPILSIHKLVPGEVLLHIGDPPDTVWFILEGSFLEERIDPITQEVQINQFWIRNDFLFTSPGFFSQQPCQSNVIARTHCVLIELDYHKFQEVAAKHELANQICERIRDRYQDRMLLRVQELRSLSHRERYDKFKKLHRNILYSTNQAKMARFLGMSLKTFGRLHRKR